MPTYLNTQMHRHQHTSDLYFDPHKLPSLPGLGVYCLVVAWELPKVAVGSRTILITTVVQRGSRQKHHDIWPLKPRLSDHGA